MERSCIDFRSLLGELPYNTIGVYSYSKYVAVRVAPRRHRGPRRDIFDKMIAKLRMPDLKALDKRYGTLVLEPRQELSSSTASWPTAGCGPNHTAGLALPQQVMMSLFPC